MPVYVISIILCFNPCFNGYSTLTSDEIADGVVVTTCFNPCFNGYSTLTFTGELTNEIFSYWVSILVLMDTLL